MAIERKHWDVVRLLLASRADANIRLSTGLTALVTACKLKNEELMTQLLDAGAAPDFPSSVSGSVDGVVWCGNLFGWFCVCSWCVCVSLLSLLLLLLSLVLFASACSGWDVATACGCG
jgi:hypothetical protein